MPSSRWSLGTYLMYPRFPDRPGIGVKIFFVAMSVDRDTVRFSWLGVPFRTLHRPDIAGVIPCSGFTPRIAVVFRTTHAGFEPLMFANRRGLDQLRSHGWPIDDPLTYRQFERRLERQYHPERFPRRPPGQRPDPAAPRPSTVLSRAAQYFGLALSPIDDPDEPDS